MVLVFPVPCESVSSSAGAALPPPHPPMVDSTMAAKRNSLLWLTNKKRPFFTQKTKLIVNTLLWQVSEIFSWLYVEIHA
jgi:hypothetical protein